MRKSKPYTRLSSADGGQTVDIHKMEESEIIKLAFECGTTGKPIVMANVSNIQREVLERAAIAGKGIVLFDLR